MILASRKVSEFVANMLGNVKPQELGTALWNSLHDRVTESRQRRGASREEIRAALASLDEALSDVNGTDVALRLLDEQILARAGQTIENEMAAQPRIAGRLEHTLGDTFSRLGLYGPAEVMRSGQSRFESGNSVGRPLTPSVPRSLLASAYSLQDRIAEAEALDSEIREIQRRVLGPNHPDTLLPMCNLACAAALRGDRKQALDRLSQAVEHGWKKPQMLSDNDALESLRGDPGFEAIVARARENAATSK